jgi:hypothetical protein
VAQWCANLKVWASLGCDVWQSYFAIEIPFSHKDIYIVSSGRACHSAASASTSSVMVEINSGGNLQPVELQQVPADLAHRHAARVHADDAVIEPGQPSLVFGHQYRVKSRVPITRDIQGQRACWGEHGLGAAAVAVIARFIARSTIGGQVIVQLRAQHALGQLLLELPDKPRFPKHILGVTASHLWQHRQCDRNRWRLQQDYDQHVYERRCELLPGTADTKHGTERDAVKNKGEPFSELRGVSRLQLFVQAIKPFFDRPDFILVGGKEGAITVIEQPCDEIPGLLRYKRVLGKYFP